MVPDFYATGSALEVEIFPILEFDHIFQGSSQLFCLLVYFISKAALFLVNNLGRAWQASKCKLGVPCVESLSTIAYTIF
jgi:hypothetical protein